MEADVFTPPHGLPIFHPCYHNERLSFVTADHMTHQLTNCQQMMWPIIAAHIQATPLAFCGILQWQGHDYFVEAHITGVTGRLFEQATRLPKEIIVVAESTCHLTFIDPYGVRHTLIREPLPTLREECGKRYGRIGKTLFCY